MQVVDERNDGGGDCPDTMEITSATSAMTKLKLMLEYPRVCIRCGSKYRELDNSVSLQCSYHPGELGPFVHNDANDLHFRCCQASTSPMCPMYDRFRPIGCTACAHTTDIREDPTRKVTVVPSSMISDIQSGYSMQMENAPKKHVLHEATDFYSRINPTATTWVLPCTDQSEAFKCIRIVVGLPRQGCQPPIQENNPAETDALTVELRQQRNRRQFQQAAWTCEALRTEADQEFTLCNRVALKKISRRMERFNNYAKQYADELPRTMPLLYTIRQ